MADDPIQGVIETIDTANKHRLHLSELLSQLEAAKSQVEKSASESKEKVESQVESLRKAMNEALDRRLQELLTSIESIQKNAMSPLVECEDIINKGVTASQSILAQGKTLLAGDHDSNRDAMIAYKKLVNDPELQSLPEVPCLSEVACIAVDLPQSAEGHLVEQLQDFGRVLGRAPVQVVEISPRPGALLVHWAEIEEENALDLSEFRLQYCPTSRGQTESSFQDIYQGAGTSFTLRHACVNTSYTFRVCGRGEGAEAWSPWSVPSVAMTTVDHHEWCQNVAGYTTCNEHKVACREGDLSTPATILYSPIQSYMCGHSIVFKVAEAGLLVAGDGIGLTVANDNQESLMHQGALLVTSQGTVYMDCCEKTTRLPPLTRGSTLTFDTEVLQNGKVRVNIEVNEKIVTFDWQVEKPPAQTDTSMSPLMAFGCGQKAEKSNEIRLYFAMKFTDPSWKVGVE